MMANIRSIVSEGTLGQEKEMFKRIIYEDFSKNMNDDLKKYEQYKRAKLRTLLTSKSNYEQKPEEAQQKVKSFIGCYEITKKEYNQHLLKEYQVQYKQKFGKDEEYFSQAFRTEEQQKKIKEKKKIQQQLKQEEASKVKKEIKYQDEESVVQDELSSHSEEQEDDDSSLDQQMSDEDIGGISETKKQKQKKKRGFKAEYNNKKDKNIEKETTDKKTAAVQQKMQTTNPKSNQISKQSNNNRSEDKQQKSHDNESDDDMFMEESVWHSHDDSKVRKSDKKRQNQLQKQDIYQIKAVSKHGPEIREQKTASVQKQRKHSSSSCDMEMDDDAIHNNSSKRIPQNKPEKKMKKEVKVSPQKVESSTKNTSADKKVKVFTPAPSFQPQPPKKQEKEPKKLKKPQSDSDEEMTITDVLQ